MSFMDLAESSLLYSLVIFGILFVIALTLLTLQKSWVRAKEIGFTKEQLNNVVRTSIITSIVPSIAILIGFFSLAAIIGVPLPWWRLSVVGSVSYELMAADMALTSSGLGLGSEILSSATATDFTLIMFVMTFCILGGLISSLFFAKKIQTGTMSLREKDVRWGSLGTSTFMLTVIAVFTLPMILVGGVTFLTWCTSLVITFILGFIIKKTGARWLSNFIMVISLLGAMAMSVVWTNLLS